MLKRITETRLTENDDEALAMEVCNLLSETDAAATWPRRLASLAHLDEEQPWDQLLRQLARLFVRGTREHAHALTLHS